MILTTKNSIINDRYYGLYIYPIHLNKKLNIPTRQTYEHKELNPAELSKYPSKKFKPVYLDFLISDYRIFITLVAKFFKVSFLVYTQLPIVFSCFNFDRYEDA